MCGAVDSDAVLWGGVALLIAYATLVLAVRAFLIRPQIRGFTVAELDGLLAEVGSRQNQKQDGVKGPSELLNDAKKALQPVTRRAKVWSAVRDVVWWTGWNEFAAWRAIHYAERLIAEDAPSETVRAQLKRVRAELDDLPRARRQAWRQAVDDALSCLDKGNESDLSRARALLVQALGALYEARDAKFAARVMRQNIATFLLFLGLLLAGVLHVLGYGLLLLPGAIGGVTVRLARHVRGARVPSDYGLAWTAVLLAPVVGALSGWGGVLLVALLQQLEILSFENLTLRVSPPVRSFDTDTTALAFLLGFSEVFLNRIAGKAEGAFVGEPEKEDGGDGTGS